MCKKINGRVGQYLTKIHLSVKMLLLKMTSCGSLGLAVFGKNYKKISIQCSANMAGGQCKTSQT